MEDPLADVPAIKVQLRPGARSVQARARRGGPEKANFTKNFVPTLVTAGMVVAALGSHYASPAMSVVKPSSVKAKVQPDSPRAWDTDSALQVENPRAWETTTSGDSIPFGSAGKLADKKPVQHRMVIDYSVVN